MKKLTSLALVVAVAIGLCASIEGQTGTAGVVAIVGVGVVPMDRETVLTNQTVIVRDGKIAIVGAAASTEVPQGAVRVEGAGKFLIPALAEMHAHIPGGQAPAATVERTLALYAVNGIATVRGMLGDPRHLEYRERAAKEELFSPRIYTSGPSLNGNSVPTKEAAIAAVTAQKAAGYDLLKIHPGIQRDVFDALVTKAAEVKIDFAGHVPLEVGLHRALEARYRSIDHLDGYIEALSKNPMQSQFFGVNLTNEVDESKIPALVAETKKAGTWMVPTQVLLDNLLDDVDPAVMQNWPEMKYALNPGEIQKWVAQKQMFLSKIPAAERATFLRLRRRILKDLHAAGVPFALGSDAPQIWNIPGFSTHRELQSLVKAGLTPYQALRTGTVAVGTYFNTPDVGMIGPGKRADLVLLDGNPLEKIENTTRIAGVVLAGRWHSRQELDQKLQ